MAQNSGSTLNSRLHSDVPSIKESSSSSDTINMVVDMCALFIGIITIWQGRIAWRARHSRSANRSHDPEGTEPVFIDVLAYGIASCNNVEHRYRHRIESYPNGDDDSIESAWITNSVAW